MDSVISLDAKRKKAKAKAKTKAEEPKVDRVAIKAKASFDAVMQAGMNLNQEDFRDYTMLVLADLIVFVLNAEYFEDAPAAIKRGVDILNKDYGPEGKKR